MNARAAILQTIRDQSGAVSTDVAAARRAIAIPQPRFAEGQHDDHTTRFTTMLGRVHGTYNIIQHIAAVPDAVGQYLTGVEEQRQLVLAPHADITALNWHGFAWRTGAAGRDDRVSVTRAAAGIAETGTLALVCSPTSPVTLNFLPEINIVVLREAELVATLEQFWATLGPLPRAVNLITGPSKTADIEQTIVYGAHGPRRLHVLLVSG